MYLSVLGRQTGISLAELEAVFEGVKQGDSDAPPVGFNLRLLNLWRGNDHFFRGILNLYNFIKLYRHTFHVRLVSCTKFGRGVHYLGRCLIVRTTIRRSHTGTSKEACAKNHAQCT